MKFRQLIMLALLGVGLTACGPLVHTVSIPYRSLDYLRPAPFNNIPVVVVAEEDRNLREADRVGEFHNSMQYGRDEVFLADNDIPQTFRNAFAREFSNAGFSVGTSGKEVNIKVAKFFARNEHVGPFNNPIIGRGELIVEVRDAYGRLMLERTYTTKVGNNERDSSRDYKKVLQQVMGQLVRDVMHDQAIMQALYYRTY